VSCLKFALVLTVTEPPREGVHRQDQLELKEAETGPKDGRSGLSAWRRSVVKKEAAPGAAER
jgi:hypothetical protein